MSKFNQLLGTVRAANFPTVATNVVAAWLIAGGMENGEFSGLGWLLAGALLVYAGGALLNDVMDYRFDFRNRPERAIPAGVLPLSLAWGMAVGMLIAGALILFFLAGASGLFTALLCGSVVLYDIVHKKWSGAVLLMAACRMWLWVVAASPLGLTSVVWLWAGMSAVFIVAITWIARRESIADASAPVLPRILLLLPVAGIFYSTMDGGVMVFGGIFLASVFWALRIFRQDHDGCVKQGVEWLLATIPLLDAMAVAPVSVAWAAVIAGGGVLCHCFQRRFAAS